MVGNLKITLIGFCFLTVYVVNINAQGCRRNETRPPSRFQFNLCRPRPPKATFRPRPPLPSPAAAGSLPSGTDEVLTGTGERHVTFVDSTGAMIDDTEECPPSPICPTRPNRFYTPDGSCNNLLDGRKGMAGQPHKRLLPADFADGKGLPRTGQNGKPLPSARSISTYMNELGAPASNDISFFLVIFGQYLTHDITDTPVVHRAGLDCFCGSEDPGCDNIEVPTNDVFYLEAQRSCINFVRSQPVPDSNCDTQVRQTRNNITPYIDAGTVYGANQFQLGQLLDHTSRVGKLKTGRLEPYGHSPRHSPSLPLTRQVHHTFAEEIACPVNVHKPDGVDCFAAGDVRANENPGLASMHTLFVRLHNKIVVELSAINRIWSKERLINTARLIVSAVEQRITYDQFLPALLGSTIMKRFDLNLNQQGYWHGYDATYDATTSNAFITSVLRVGHTLVSPELPRSSPSYHQQGTSLQLLNSFFDTTPLLTTSFGGANSILRGLTNTAAQTMDPAFVEDLQNFLFAPAGMYGVDLMSLNIQRARDHGVPSYNEFRVFCGLKRAFTFDELTEIPRQRRRKLQHLYRNVDDIDLYIAGISEAPLKEGLLGPTFACLAGYQFRDIKKGDRLWHENGGAFTVFTPAQLQAIRDYTMSKVLCDNLNDMVSVQSNPFLQISVIGNIRRPCSQYPALNLEAWKDKNCDEQPSRKVGRVFTSWFPANHDGHSLSSQQVLSDLFLNRPDDVCSKTLGSEERIVKGNKQIRFICPAGSIRGSDFPNVDESKGAWSFWENEFTPSYPDFGDEEIAGDVSRERCEGPIAIQVFTTNGIPARESGEVFRVLSPSAGFECRGEDQEDGRCEDYKVRYFCKKVHFVEVEPTRTEPPTTESTTPATSVSPNPLIWTPWVSYDTPNTGNGDEEYLFDVDGRPGFCGNPVDIQARTVVGKTPHFATGDHLTLSPNVGLICRNRGQIFRRCKNYEVRYQCRSRDIFG